MNTLHLYNSNGRRIAAQAEPTLDEKDKMIMKEYCIYTRKNYEDVYRKYINALAIPKEEMLRNMRLYVIRYKRKNRIVSW